MENTMTTFKKIKSAEVAVDSYYKKLETCEKSAWSLAQLIYDTVNAPNFDECFKSLREYAKAIGSDVSSVSRKCKAVERKLYIEQNLEDLPKLGVSHIIETAPIKNEQLEEFITLNEITEKSTVKEVREAMKDFCKKAKDTEDSAEDVDDTAEDVDDTAEENAEDANSCVMSIEYAGTTYEIHNAEVINKILELLN